MRVFLLTRAMSHATTGTVMVVWQSAQAQTFWCGRSYTVSSFPPHTGHISSASHGPGFLGPMRFIERKTIVYDSVFWWSLRSRFWRTTSHADSGIVTPT